MLPPETLDTIQQAGQVLRDQRDQHNAPAYAADLCRAWVDIECTLNPSNREPRRAELDTGAAMIADLQSFAAEVEAPRLILAAIIRANNATKEAIHGN